MNTDGASAWFTPTVTLPTRDRSGRDRDPRRASAREREPSRGTTCGRHRCSTASSPPSCSVMRDRGLYPARRAPSPDTNVVLHVVDADAPEAVPPQGRADLRDRDRRSCPTSPTTATTSLRIGYPLLVRGAREPLRDGAPTRPTAGRALRHARARDLRRRPRPRRRRPSRASVFARIEPLAVVAARHRQRLRRRPPRAAVGRRRPDRADAARRDARSTPSTCCPRPFPIEEILGPRDLRHVMLLYGIGGLSYGNVSARYLGGDLRGVPDADDPVYWMSASGVDKSDLRARRRAHPAGARLRRRTATRWC